MPSLNTLGIILFSLLPLTVPPPSARLLSSAQPPTKGADALRAIVGVWQSDTTGGMSALSNCVWTPAHGAVLCDQTISTPKGDQHALNLFTFDAAGGSYVLYGLQHPGDPMRLTPLAIKGSIWIYGGTSADSDGITYRTVNDFSAPDRYSWWQESSKNGEQWTKGVHGQVKRVR